MKILAMLLIFGPALTGCVAAKVETAPIKVGAKAVDVMTTSQSEADQKRGRALRERDEKIEKLLYKRDKAARNCPESETACIKAQGIEAEIQALRSRRI